MAKSEISFTESGLAEFTKQVESSADNLLNNLVKEARFMAEQIAGDARKIVPVSDSGDGSTGGALHDSIIGFVEVDSDNITAGAKSNSPYAVYVEFGTGPTGQKVGHPLDKELGVVRKSDKWRVNIPDIGVRWIAGQKPQPYLYPAMKQNEEELMRRFGAAAEMAVKKE